MPEISISLSNRNNGTLKVEATEITAEGYYGYPRLIIPVHLKLNPDYDYNNNVKPYTVLNIQSSIVLPRNSIKIADSLSTFIGRSISSDGHQFSPRIEFPLNFPQVSRIEKERQEDLNLRLGFDILIAYYKRLPIGEKANNEIINVTTDFDYRHFDLNLEIPQSHWVKKVLPLLGANDCFIIEIPKGEGLLKDAWNYLEKAETALRIWNSKEVYGNCRDCGTLLDKTIKEESGEGNYIYALKWNRAYKEFNYFASLGLHSEDPKSSSGNFSKVDIKKPDCECLILMTKALTKYAEELLEEGKLSGRS